MTFDRKFFLGQLLIQTALLLFSGSVTHAESFDWLSSLTNISANISPSAFSITSITGSSQVIETEAALGFPTAKLYTFKLCLTHSTIKEPLKKRTVTIDGANAPINPQILDNSCLTWMESINYHFTAPSRYVTLVRNLGIHDQSPSPSSQPFSIPFRLAINPWLHGESSATSEVADFIKTKPRNSIPPSEAAKTLAGKIGQGSEVSLIANDARVNFQELGIDSKRGGKFSFDFRTTPQIEVLNAANQPVYLKLTQGEFEFEAYLISTLYEGENQVRHLITPQPIKGHAKLSDGALALQQEITLPIIPTRGRIELAVTLVAQQDQAFLKPFKGIYILGDYNDLKTNLYARIKTGYTNANTAFNFEDYLGLKKETDKTYSHEAQDGMRPLKYEFEPLQFKITGIGNETALKRQVFYQVKACIRNGIDNSPLRGYHFRITKAGSLSDSDENILPTTRASEFDSCIYWDDRIDHDYYASQKYFRVEYRIENHDLNLDESLVAFINPWEISLSRDGRTIEPTEIARESKASKGPSFLFIPNFQLQTRTITYSINSLMKLTVKKQVHLLLEPKVINYSNLSRGIDSRESIRDGIWKIRWALLHNRHESQVTAFKVLSRGESLSVATQGRIVLPVNLEFNDFRFISSRNYIMIEIAPVDPSKIIATNDGGLLPGAGNNFESIVDLQSGLSPQTFIGPLLSMNDGDSSYLIPHPENPALKQFIAQINTDGTPNNQLNENDLFVFEKSAPDWSQLSNQTREILGDNELEFKRVKDSLLQANSIQTWNVYGDDLRNLRKLMGPSAYTLQNFSQKYQRPLFVPEMVTRAIDSKSLTAELEDRLCFYFFDQDPHRSIRFKNNLVPWIQSDRWLKKCLLSVAQKENSFFNAQIETVVDHVDNTLFRGSSASNLSIGANFSVNSSESVGVSTSVGASTNIGLSIKLSDLFSMGASTSYGISRSESQSQSSGNSLSISTGVSLNVRKLTLLVSGTSSERCLTAQISPDLYADKKSNFWRDLVHSTGSPELASAFVNRTIRFCYSIETPQKFQALENYYFILQDNQNVGFIDNPDLRNKPLLLELRGQTAFENFLRISSGDLQLSNQSGSANVGNFSTDARANKALHLKIPTIPGSITEIIGR